MISTDIRDVHVEQSYSEAWGGRVDVYWRRNLSRKHKYRALRGVIDELTAIDQRDWNMRHTDSVNKTTLYFRDATDAVSFSFYVS